MSKFLTVKNALDSPTRDASAYTGGAEARVDTDAISASISKGLALLTRADRAKVIAAITRSSGRAPGHTSEVGISTQDDAVARGRAERDHNNSIVAKVRETGERMAEIQRNAILRTIVSGPIYAH